MGLGGGGVGWGDQATPHVCVRVRSRSWDCTRRGRALREMEISPRAPRAPCALARFPLPSLQSPPPPPCTQTSQCWCERRVEAWLRRGNESGGAVDVDSPRPPPPPRPLPAPFAISRAGAFCSHQSDASACRPQPLRRHVRCRRTGAHDWGPRACSSLAPPPPLPP